MRRRRSSERQSNDAARLRFLRSQAGSKAAREWNSAAPPPAHIGTQYSADTFNRSTETSLLETMSDEVQPLRVVTLRADCYSADRENVVISLRMKYSMVERKYSVPLECLRDLVVDFRRLSSATPDVPTENTHGETEPLLPLGLPTAAE